MTHTLHRYGDEASLSGDYTILAMPSSGLNSDDSKPKLAKALEIFLRHDPVNIGDSKGGSRFSLGGDDKVRDILVDNELVHGVFRTKEQLTDVLKELKEADLGLSVTVGGLSNKLKECCGKADLTPHTTVQSLGIMGNLSKLPTDEVLQVATMCGHHLVSFNLIDYFARKVKMGSMTAEKAGEKLAQCCICGIFNPVRAAEVIEQMASKEA